MAKRALELAKLFFEAEPDALVRDPAAAERVSQALARINGGILAATLFRQGDEALDDAVRRIAKTVELAARESVSGTLLLRDDTGDPPDTID